MLLELRASRDELATERHKKEEAEREVASKEVALREQGNRHDELGEQLRDVEKLKRREKELESEVETLKKGGDKAALIELEVKRELRRIVEARSQALEREEAAARKKEEERRRFESYALALATVNLAASGALRAVHDAALRWAGRRSERWRLPIFDFLNNYRVGSDRRLQHGAHRKPAADK